MMYQVSTFMNSTVLQAGEHKRIHFSQYALSNKETEEFAFCSLMRLIKARRDQDTTVFTCKVEKRGG